MNPETDDKSVRGTRESLEQWKTRADKLSNQPSKIPVSLLKAVFLDEDHVIWNLNYKAYQKAWQEASLHAEKNVRTPEKGV